MSASIALFRYSEAKLADRIRVSRGLLKDIRARVLDPDRDWQNVSGEIALSVRGIKRLWRELRPGVAAFDLRDCLLVAPVKKNCAGASSSTEPGHVIPLGHLKMPIPIRVQIVTVCLNPSVVLATDDHGTRLLVWVGRNEHFTVGMIIPAIPKKNAPGMWAYTGPLPRRPYTPAEWARRTQAGFNA